MDKSDEAMKAKHYSEADKPQQGNRIEHETYWIPTFKSQSVM